MSGSGGGPKSCYIPPEPKRRNKVPSKTSSQGKSVSSEFDPVTHVIFSVDGVLTNAETINKTIYADIASQYKRGPVTVEMNNSYYGRSEADRINMLIRDLGLPARFQKVQSILKEEEQKRLGKTKIMPGSERLICHLVKAKIPIAIATSGTKENFDIKFSKVQSLLANFHHIVYGTDDEEVEHGKPDPTIYKVCCSRFDENPDPKSVLAIESSPAGVAAACCANLQVVMIPDPAVESDCCLTRDATVVLKSLGDFKPEQFGLPPIPQ